jgi:uncharacterized protein (DUF305 family)
MQWSGAAITLSLMLCLQVPPNLSSASAAESFEYQFLAASDAAMKKMMKDMTIEKSGNIDRDFINMMIPHHQGAIDMARAELLFGKNEQLRRIAQEIVVAQQQEIVAMRLAIPATPAMPLAEK